MKARSQYWWSILCVVAALIVIAGWAELRFVCDDAYIAFRYVSNARDGHGLVWNRAPFASGGRSACGDACG